MVTNITPWGDVDYGGGCACVEAEGIQTSLYLLFSFVVGLKLL